MTAVRSPVPIVLLPGLLCSPRLYAPQLPALWRFGPVTVANTLFDDSLAAMARRMLAEAPPRFALAGLSMGGYLAFEILRQAPERVLRLALLDTTARPDTPESSATREAQIGHARAGRFTEMLPQIYRASVHPSRWDDAVLRDTLRMMNEDVGPEAFVRQQRAIMGRPDSRPGLADIRCRTLVLVGDADALTPPEHATEIAAGITGARLVTVPRCGHVSTLDQPEAVTQALEAWLAAE